MAEHLSDPRWKSIPVVVAETGLKERTLYRLVAKGALPSQKTESGTLVDVEAAKAFAAAKAAARRPAMSSAASHDGGRQAAAGGGNLAEDGELAARVIARLEEGATPIEIVKELRLPPQRVRQLHREWRSLREDAAQADQGPSVVVRLGSLEEGSATNDARWEWIQERLGALGDRLSKMAKFGDLVKCECGSRGKVRLLVRCTGCGQQGDVAWPLCKDR